MTASHEPGASVRWSSRQFRESDRDAVLRLFTAPDFYFRDPQPELLSEPEIITLLADAHVIEADGEPVGLHAVEPVGARHACHFRLDFRLSADQPDSRWQTAYREIVLALRERTEVVRVTVLAAEFDRRLTGILRGLGLTEEGLLADVVLHRGRRYGYRFFAQIWEPSS
jgi:hypothetical protein